MRLQNISFCGVVPEKVNLDPFLGLQNVSGEVSGFSMSLTDAISEIFDLENIPEIFLVLFLVQQPPLQTITLGI